jgi:hypothetical protein
MSMLKRKVVHVDAANTISSKRLRGGDQAKRVAVNVAVVSSTASPSSSDTALSNLYLSVLLETSNVVHVTGHVALDNEAVLNGHTDIAVNQPFEAIINDSTVNAVFFSSSASGTTHTLSLSSPLLSRSSLEV